MELTEEEFQALTYGDFLTHKVNLMFPKLFKSSGHIDKLAN